MTLEAEFVFRKPGELNRCRGHRLPCPRICRRARRIDRRQPVLKGKIAIELKVFADALHRLKVNVIQRGPARNKVLRCFLRPHAHLDPLVAAEVVSRPRLAAFIFASNPIAQKHAFVGIPLPLNTQNGHQSCRA